MPQPMQHALPSLQLNSPSLPHPKTTNYGVAQHEYGVRNPSEAPEFKGAVGLSETTRGTQGHLTWLAKQVGGSMPLSLSKQFHRTDITF